MLQFFTAAAEAKVLTVDDYGRIRRAARDGMSIREIARTFHHSRRKVREVLRGDGQPQPYPKRQSQPAPALGAFHEAIEQILREDESNPPKQRHTMMRIFERLRDEHGYSGSYSSVRRFLVRHRDDQRETFIPLDHESGQRIEADFGEIAVDFPDGRRKVNVLILVWSYSNAPFAIALPTQRTEAILEGMVQAFEFFGCVPREVWWDNPKTVAAAIFSGRDRQPNPRYAALASHYVFEPLYCLPAKGNEKPVVENRVKTLQRKWSTPVPKMQNFEELNAYLRTCCEQESQRCSSGQTETIGTRFAQEKAQAAELPSHRFDPCVRQAAKVNKYQLARFDTVSYSVPRNCAFQAVTVKGYVDRVEIVHQDAVVARHSRSYEHGDQVLDPLHYLITLGRRPAALDHSNVYRQWTLPAVFEELRERLEERHGARAGVRQYIRVLQLLAQHPLERVQSAIEQLRGPDGADAERIIRRVERSATHTKDQERTSAASVSHDELTRPEVLSVQVPAMDLNHFNQFLSSPNQGNQDDDDHNHPVAEQRSGPDAAAGQSQAIASTDAARGVRETRPGSRRDEPDVRAISVDADRTRSHCSSQQRSLLANQTGPVSGGEGSRQLRLLGHAVDQQTTGPGTGALPVDSRPFECVFDRASRYGEVAFGCGVGLGRLS